MSCTVSAADSNAESQIPQSHESHGTSLITFDCAARNCNPISMTDSESGIVSTTEDNAVNNEPGKSPIMSENSNCNENAELNLVGTETIDKPICLSVENSTNDDIIDVATNLSTVDEEQDNSVLKSSEQPFIDEDQNKEFGRTGEDGGSGQDREEINLSHAGNSQQGSQVIPDEAGNLRILVRKTKPLLGIAIEGGANTRHPLPRIININENGAAYDAGGLQVGQLILEVDGHKVEGMHHQEVARLIAESFAQRDKPHIEFLVVEAKKSNLEPKPTALIFLEA